MAFLPVLNTALVTVHMTLGGQVVVNTFHVRNTVAWNETNLTTLANLFITWMNSTMAAGQSLNVQYEKVTARDLTSETSVAVEVAFPALSGGDDTAESLPGNVALAVKHNSSAAGRATRGRTYVVGIPEPSGGPSGVTNAYRDGVVGFFNTLLANLNTAGFEWVTVSKYNGSTCDVDRCKKIATQRTTAVITPVTTNSANTQIDSQRRRLPGRGI